MPTVLAGVILSQQYFLKDHDKFLPVHVSVCLTDIGTFQEQ